MRRIDKKTNEVYDAIEDSIVDLGCFLTATVLKRHKKAPINRGFSHGGIYILKRSGLLN